MKIAVTDANIFIDLIRLNMLALLFSIEMEIYTAQEVIDQLNDDQSRELAAFLGPQHLKVYRLSEKELEEVVAFEAPRSLELADRAVAWLSIRLEATVLTGDGVLRKFCQTKRLEVRGIIWFFDCLVERELYTPQFAASKLTELQHINPRLPRNEITIRLQKWGMLTA
ncbi:hypothetical protein [Puia dinghuensis]|uniref:PIN domain-containing protein n=1 Tax=Puia dinghuensis TaxID=1792502 RepID=A0A8J2XQP8_9BACT|nr:hypothetical protein [Puia dinghuensis]GGA94935.1 hypothetical protein GCM10011511_17810 [Puia dinghuensis]